MINIVWLILILGGFLAAVFTGKVEETTQAAFDSAKYAVELGFSLMGIYILWLGLMRVAQKSGLVKAFSARIAPILKMLFPDVPASSSAMGAMCMNIVANMLGLGNAATPLGINAMKELNKLNRDNTAPSDAMCLFLVINTASIQLIPTTVIALRSAAGSANPAEIVGTTLAATLCSALTGITASKILKRFY
ncbi:MAG TPA: nucleoside recognition protein [Clostridiales bacterium]|nr:nucleoside recognition protein [Clostridiales bacterium]